jgi:hypothetical protein
MRARTHALGLDSSERPERAMAFPHRVQEGKPTEVCRLPEEYRQRADGGGAPGAACTAPPRKRSSPRSGRAWRALGPELRRVEGPRPGSPLAS